MSINPGQCTEKIRAATQHRPTAIMVGQSCCFAQNNSLPGLPAVRLKTGREPGRCEEEAWTSLARVFLASNEFIYVD